MSWTNELDTGIPEIDSENRKIVDYINMISDAQAAGDRNKLGEVLELLLDYVVNHFLFEEHMMEEANYEFRVAHEKVHEIFAKKLADFRGTFKDGGSPFDEVLAMLNRWVDDHIRVEDKRYADSVIETIEQKGGQTWISGVMKKIFG